MLTMAGSMLLASAVLIVLWPAVLPWLVGAMVISVGAGMVTMAQMFRRLSTTHCEARE